MDNHVGTKYDMVDLHTHVIAQWLSISSDMSVKKHRLRGFYCPEVVQIKSCSRSQTLKNFHLRSMYLPAILPPGPYAPPGSLSDPTSSCPESACLSYRCHARTSVRRLHSHVLSQISQLLPWAPQSPRVRLRPVRTPLRPPPSVRTSPVGFVMLWWHSCCLRIVSKNCACTLMPHFSCIVLRPIITKLSRPGSTANRMAYLTCFRVRLHQQLQRARVRFNLPFLPCGGNHPRLPVERADKFCFRHRPP